MNNDPNVIYQDDENKVIILLNHMGTDYSEYKIVVCRETLGTRFRVHHGQTILNRHVLIMDAFKKIGWKMKLTINGRFYSVARKKDRFRFLLRYGKYI